MVGGSIGIVVLGLLIAGGVGGERASVALNDLSAVGAAAVAACLCLRAARRGGPDRRGWLLLGIASVLWAFGEGVWSLYEVVLSREVPFPSIADVAYLGAVLPAMAGVLVFTRGFETGQRLRSLVDATMVALGLLQVCWALVLGPAWRGNDPLLAQIVNVAYPVSDLLLVTLAAIVCGWGRAANRAGLTAVATALSMMALCDITFTWLVNHGTYSSANPIGIGWVAAYLVLGFAARLPPPPETEASAPRAQSLLALVLPCVVVVAAFLVVVPRLVTGDPLGTLLTANGIVLVALALLRQSVTTVDLRNTVRALHRREAELAVLAMQDGLTGLANRSRFSVELEAALDEDPTRVAVVYLDLDGFKGVNDRLGHAVGDAVLISAARRLEACAGAGMLVARLGGDEFVVLVTTGEADAIAFASDALRALASALSLEGERLTIGASIGVAAAASSGSAEDTVRRADAAMYAAKARGKGRAVLHPDESLALIEP